jgi:hypothetical protein
MVARHPPQAHDGVAVDAQPALGLADAAALLEVGQDGARLVVVEPAAEKGGALALGEAPLTGLAVEQAALRAVAGADGDVASAARAVALALGVKATEAPPIVHAETRQTGQR